MGRRAKAASKTQQEEIARQADQVDKPDQALDKTPERKSIVLPAYIWRVLEGDAEDQLRTLSRQIEAVMINYYQLGLHKIDGIDKSPGSYGFVRHVDMKAS